MGVLKDEIGREAAPLDCILLKSKGEEFTGIEQGIEPAVPGEKAQDHKDDLSEAHLCVDQSYVGKLAPIAVQVPLNVKKGAMQSCRA